MERSNYIMVRPNTKNPSNFLDNGIVAVGWSSVNFSNFSGTENLFSDKKMSYLKKIAPQSAGRYRGQISRFQNISEGDRLIIPAWDCFCLAIATKERTYNEEQIGADQANELHVSYLRGTDGNLLHIPRDYLSEGLQRRMRVRGMTVTDLNGFSEELCNFFDQAIREHTVYRWEDELEKKKEINISTFKNKLLNNIQSGKTNLKTGGIGLEKLVLELVRLEGYENPYIPSKRFFPSFADADIIASKTDMFSDINLLIQIKHHSGVSNDWGISQLLEIKKIADFENYKLVFVTSAAVSKEVLDRSEENDITVIDGISLVDWIYKLLDEIPFLIKQQLGILESPQIL